MIGSFFKFRIVKIVLLGGAGLIAFIFLMNLWVLVRASGIIYDDLSEVPERPVGLVLGTSQRTVGGGTNAFFSTRMEAAARLYKSGKVRKLIVSGDNGDPRYNETADMREYLIRLGVPREDIVEDFAGFRTLDSVVRAKTVFGIDKLIIISQDFHLPRAIFIARAHGIDAVGYRAEDPLHRQAYFKVLFREYLARVRAVFDCYLLGTEPRFPGPPEHLRL